MSCLRWFAIHLSLD